MFSLGNSVVGSPCASGGSVIGRVSVADASLSLSLSLWDSCLLGARSLRRGFAVGAAGQKARLGFSCPRPHSRVVGALSAWSGFRALGGRRAREVFACLSVGWCWPCLVTGEGRSPLFLEGMI